MDIVKPKKRYEEHDVRLSKVDELKFVKPNSVGSVSSGGLCQCFLSRVLILMPCSWCVFLLLVY